MATKFVALVIAVALLFIASSVGNPLEEKFGVSSEKPTSAYVCRTERSDDSSSGACALVLPLCR